MPTPWLATLAEMAARAPVVRVTVIRAEGSTPREAGAAMLVTDLGFSGTIGGGALEHAALAAARAMLAAFDPGPWPREVRDYALGPALCQCCGGYAWVLFERFGPAEYPVLAALARALRAGQSALLARPMHAGPPLVRLDRRDDAAALPAATQAPIRAMLAGFEPFRPHLTGGSAAAPAWFVEPIAATAVPLYLYGAGHVGREVARVTAGLGFDLHWVDTAPDRFPETLPAHARLVVTADPSAIAAAALTGAFHLVMTYSHDLDYRVCSRLLAKPDFAWAGLIGSATKRARFVQRLRAEGHTDATLARLRCPIGIEGLTGKAPSVIAVAVAAELLFALQTRP